MGQKIKNDLMKLTQTIFGFLAHCIEFLPLAKEKFEWKENKRHFAAGKKIVLFLEYHGKKRGKTW